MLIMWENCVIITKHDKIEFGRFMLKKRKIRKIFNRNFLIILMMLVQVSFLAMCLLRIWQNVAIILGFQTVLGFVFVCYIVNRQNTNPAYKLVWSIVISLFPLFGSFLYILIHADLGIRNFKRVHNYAVKKTKPLLPQDYTAMKNIESENPYIANLARYVHDFGGYPIYRNTYVEYFGVGEEKFDALIRELEKAEKFIFLEYFIIDQGYVWNTVFDILKRKAAQGVDVRLMYDGMGTQMILPNHYEKYIASKGIKCKVFNPFRPFLSSVQNNRDHRKIVVIDGETAFNGGINLADEYINEKIRFGHWKDTAVMLKGEAVWSFTMMFLQMWGLDEKKGFNYTAYKPQNSYRFTYDCSGYVMPYGDSPTDDENVGELVYLDIINKAKKYVYITTPYLIIDNEMITALGFAVKSGVDVRIIVPHIPDKWYVNVLSWNYYKELIKLGVKIYEYIPGFIHAKNFVSDDHTAIVGTINMDYRSLYLHFECATLMHNTKSVYEVKRDFVETLKKCRKITLRDCDDRPVLKKAAGSVLRLVAPLL